MARGATPSSADSPDRATARHPGGRPRKWKSVADMQKAIDAYFADTEPPYTVTGLALALDMTRRGLLDYEERGEFAHTVKVAKARVEAEMEAWMLRGDGWGPGHIFSLKNNFQWRDTQHVEAKVGIDDYSQAAREVLDRIPGPGASGKDPQAE